MVVASLIDNTPNIAGLVRSCEIFQAEEVIHLFHSALVLIYFQVVVKNKKIVSDAQFQRVSVSAEKWIPIIEVAPNNLASYLSEKREMGYTILGVEQTAHSESLSTYQFPDKCVLVLGQEQLGISPDILLLLDKVL